MASVEMDYLRLRRQTLVQDGVTFYCDYGGVDCAREAVEKGFEGLSLQNGWQNCPPPRFLRTSEIEPGPRGILKRVAIDWDKCESCVQGDLARRMPKIAQEYVLAALPAEGATKQERAEAHREIRKWLSANRSWIFADRLLAPCYVHPGRNCPAAPFGFSGDSEDRRRVRLRHDGREEEVPTRHMSVNIAGVTCVAYCSSGLHEGEAHSSEVDHSIWLCERRAKAEQELEDVFFVECSTKYPFESKVGAECGDTHLLLAINDDPVLHGWPAHRDRMSAVGLSRATTRWLGPDQQDLLEADFKQRFHKALACSAEIFMRESSVKRNEDLSRMAAIQKYILTPEEIAQLPNDELIEYVNPPGALQRLEQWEAKYAPSAASFPGAYFFNFMRHPKYARAGSWSSFPTLETNTMIASVLPGKGTTIATGTEYFASLGFHMFEPSGDGWGLFGQSKIAPYILESAPHLQRGIAGNGMNLLAQAAWIYYVLGHVVNVRGLSDMPPRMKNATETEFDCEDL